VDTRINFSEENYKLPKENVSENKKQRRTMGDKQRGILRSKGNIRGDNKKGENQIVERIMHSNNRSQLLEYGVWNGISEEENQHTDNKTSKTRWLTDMRHKREPQTDAGILYRRRQRLGRQQSSKHIRELT